MKRYIKSSYPDTPMTSEEVAILRRVEHNQGADKYVFKLPEWALELAIEFDVYRRGNRYFYLKMNPLPEDEHIEPLSFTAHTMKDMNNQLKDYANQFNYSITSASDLTSDSDGDDRGEFELVDQSDLDIDLPDRITLTDNGAYDLEKQGMNGVYTWVGYQHKGGRSEQKMAKAVENFAYDVVAPALAAYVSMPEDSVEIENHINQVDMFRVWVELP